MQVIDWLLGEGNPGVRVRALTGLCGLPDDHAEVDEARRQVTGWLDAARDYTWMSRKGLPLIYGLTALAESGLRRKDVPVDDAIDRLLAQPFDAGCGDMMGLRALYMLGYGDDPRVRSRLAQATETQLPDGGWLCLHRLKKLDRVPKSCIKAAMHALLLAGEMKKRGLSLIGAEKLVEYFDKRRLFYRMDDPSRLVLDCPPGWRMTDVFFPIEVMRVGLPMLIDALAVLGAGRAPGLREAWDLLDAKLDPMGRIVLEGTLGQSYLPKERVGRPGKWPTLYALLAWKTRDRDLAT